MIYKYASENREFMKNHTASMKQMAGVRRSVLDDGKERGVRIADIYNGSGLNFSVILDRGLDIGNASFRGIPLAWVSPAGFCNPSFYEPEGLGWLRSWGAGLMTGCGMRNVGAPDKIDGENIGLHGRLSHIPAGNISTSEEWLDGKYTVSVSGEMRECRTFGENIILKRKIGTVMGENTINIEDVMENQGTRPCPAMLLYHINLGYPLLSEDSILKAVPHQVAPRDETAAAGAKSWDKCRKPTAGWSEQCFYHDIPADDDGYARIALFNPALKLETVVAYRKKELPFLTQWKQMGQSEYVMGLEPANCHVEGVSKEKEKFASLKILQPGEKTAFNVRITVTQYV